MRHFASLQAADPLRNSRFRFWRSDSSRNRSPRPESATNSITRRTRQTKPITADPVARPANTGNFATLSALAKAMAAIPAAAPSQYLITRRNRRLRSVRLNAACCNGSKGNSINLSRRPKICPKKNVESVAPPPNAVKVIEYASVQF